MWKTEKEEIYTIPVHFHTIVHLTLYVKYFIYHQAHEFASLQKLNTQFISSFFALLGRKHTA